MISDNISGILGKITAICQRIGRDPNDIVLVGVTKFADISRINEAIKSGLRHVGENKVQEAQKKFSSIEVSNAKVTRHMIGHLQTNKVKQALENFDIIQSVDSLKLATALEDQAARQDQNIDILLQVNTAGEAQKFGLEPSEVITVIKEIVRFKHVHLLGLMAIAPLTQETEPIRKCFRDLRVLGDQIRTQFCNDNIEMKYLSMGMTGDYEIALEEGSNMLRIGRAIFQ
jgi:hypothetical protein